MMGRVIPLLLLPIILLASAACRDASDVEADRAAARRLIGEYEQAVNAGDPDRIMALYAEDAIWMPERVRPLVGKRAIRNRVEGALREISLDKRWQVHEVIVAGDWAIVRATGSGTVTDKTTGHVESESHNELFLLERQPDRGWKIARFIYNSDSPPSESSSGHR